MNRRAFLFGAAASVPLAVAATSAPVVAVRACAPSWAWWPTRWWVKEFDWGMKRGVMLEAVNVLTGERRCHGAKLMTTNDPVFKDRGIRTAKSLLLTWMKELPA